MIFRCAGSCRRSDSATTPSGRADDPDTDPDTALDGEAIIAGGAGGFVTR